MSRKGTFDTDGLYAAINAQRLTKGMTWKQIAQETGMSASTLTRLGQGKRPDVDGVASLLAWSGLTAEPFIDRVGRPEQPATLAQVSTSLRQDPALTPESAAALERIFAAAYEQLRAAERSVASGTTDSSVRPRLTSRRETGR